MTSSALQLCIEAIVDTVSGVGGISNAPDYPTETMNIFPFLVVYAERGSCVQEPIGVMKGLHTIRAEIHINRKNLPIDVARMMVFTNSVPMAIMKDQTIKGTCETFRNITYNVMEVSWANIATLALVFSINDVKIQEIIT